MNSYPSPELREECEALNRGDAQQQVAVLERIPFPEFGGVDSGGNLEELMESRMIEEITEATQDEPVNVRQEEKYDFEEKKYFTEGNAKETKLEEYGEVPEKNEENLEETVETGAAYANYDASAVDHDGGECQDYNLKWHYDKDQKVCTPFCGVSDFLGTLDSHECLVLGGDFNTTLEERDRAGAELSPAAANILREIVEHHSLVDVWRDYHPDDTSTFTFVRVEAHRSHHSRLVRIYLSRFHLSQAHSNIWLAPFSDHHLATITASLRAERPGPAYWHFNNSLLEDEGFVTSFREFWLTWREQWRAFPSVQRWLDLGKVHARGTSRRRNAAIEQLEREVLELERRLAASSEDPFL
ncbi:unnamed protein product [Caretta caretta]